MKIQRKLLLFVVFVTDDGLQQFITVRGVFD
jgi:hypothetical protein